MQIVLAGNPNAGKTTLFNALTHRRLKTGNWHGVTTTAVQATKNGVSYIDVPGAYSFLTHTMEEKEAAYYVRSADVLINVVDALTLQGSLHYTQELLAQGKKTVLFLTKTKALKRRGGWVDVKKLSATLGVSVVADSVNELKKLLQSGKVLSPQAPQKIPFNQVYMAGNLRLRGVERLFYNRIAACFLFVATMLLTFFIAFYPLMPGALFKGLCEQALQALISVAQRQTTHPVVRSLVCEGVLGGIGGVLCFLPQLAVLYLATSLLEQSGVLSALSFVTDGLFERVRLSGRAVFSLLTGFGCTAAAIETTKGYASPVAQKRTVAALPYIPCGAKLPVLLTFLSPLFSNPFPVLCLLYFIAIGAALLVCLLIKGGGEELLSEVAPVGLPHIKTVIIDLFFYLKGFIIKIVTTVALFCLVSWLFSHFTFSFVWCAPQDSMLGVVSKRVVPVFMPMGIADWRFAYAVLTGAVAKENVVASLSMLAPEGLNLGFAPMLAASVFMLFCPACITATAASVKACGLRFTLVNLAIQTGISLVLGYFTYFIFGILL